jgi:hypothetical protein
VAVDGGAGVKVAERLMQDIDQLYDEFEQDPAIPLMSTGARLIREALADERRAERLLILRWALVQMEAASATGAVAPMHPIVDYLDAEAKR